MTKCPELNTAEEQLELPLMHVTAMTANLVDGEWQYKYRSIQTDEIL